MSVSHDFQRSKGYGAKFQTILKEFFKEILSVAVCPVDGHISHDVSSQQSSMCVIWLNVLYYRLLILFV